MPLGLLWVLGFLACATPVPAVRVDLSPLGSGEAGVACVDRDAARVGAEVLARGGNAADALVAAALALSVTWPPAASLGAGGVLVARTPDGEVLALDFRETAPAAVHSRFFLDAEGLEDGSVRAHPALPVGVPGLTAGLGALHERLGSRPWRELVRPAIELARDGHVVDATYQRFVDAAASDLARWPSSRAALLDGEARAPAPGTLRVQPQLAATLERIARGGPAAFYTGALAQAVADDLADVGGVMTPEDLAGYRAVWRAPLRVELPDGRHTLLAMPPPSAGGITVAQVLTILQLLDAPGLDAPPGRHLFVEATRRAFADRSRHLGDPDQVHVPVRALLAREHLQALADSIDPARASDSADFGPAVRRDESDDTTHLSVVDASGMLIACTITLEANCGSRYVGPRTGVLFNNQLNDFNRVPGLTDTRGRVGTPPNVAAPGKRPITSMSPTILLRDGLPVLATGSPGGRTIPSTVAALAWRVIHGADDPQRWIDAPRLHHGWFPDRVELGSWGSGRGERFPREPAPEGDPETWLRDLAELGHTVRERGLGATLRGTQGAAHSLLRLPDPDGAGEVWFMIGDPRRDGWAAVLED